MRLSGMRLLHFCCGSFPFFNVVHADAVENGHKGQALPA